MEPVNHWQRQVEDLAGRVADTLAEQNGSALVSIVLFGSLARGEAAPGSDVDLLVVLRELPDDRLERHTVFWRALEPHFDEIDALYDEGIAFDWSPILLTVDEARHHSPLYLDMVDGARLLLDREAFFAGVLEGLRARMDALGSRRIDLPDGSWCWELKPDAVLGEVIEL